MVTQAPCWMTCNCCQGNPTPYFLLLCCLIVHMLIYCMLLLPLTVLPLQSYHLLSTMYLNFVFRTVNKSVYLCTMLYFFSFHLFTCIVNVFVECGCTELLTIYWLLKYKFVFSLLFFLLKLSLTCFTEVLKKDKADNHRNWWKMKSLSIMKLLYFALL